MRSCTVVTFDGENYFGASVNQLDVRSNFGELTILVVILAEQVQLRFQQSWTADVFPGGEQRDRPEPCPVKY
jgi:hypothetical protein